MNLTDIASQLQARTKPKVALKQSAPLAPTTTPPLYVEGNQIKRKDTKEPVVLRGAVSDFFRFGFDQNVDGLIQRTSILKDQGVNTVGLYLEQRAPYHPNYSTMEDLDRLDKYLDYANKNGVYVYLMPVARVFQESDLEYAPRKELTPFVETLAKRYRNYPNVMYGFGAEVRSTSGDISEDTWKQRQEELGKIVQRYNPDAVILASSGRGYELDYFNKNPLNLKNVVYVAGGYAGRDPRPDSVDRFSYLPQTVKDEMAYKITRGQGVTELEQKHPVIFAEFGGFWDNRNGAFKSEEDYQLNKTMLEDLTRKNAHYTGFRLDPDTPGLEGIGMFDDNNQLTRKGQLYQEYFKRQPATSVQTPQMQIPLINQTPAPYKDTPVNRILDIPNQVGYRIGQGAQAASNWAVNDSGTSHLIRAIPQATQNIGEGFYRGTNKALDTKPSDIFSHFSDLANQISNTVKPIFKIK